ncbi:MAG TPA: CBS domain-containing protein [Longimicrobiaceae bacterium]
MQRYARDYRGRYDESFSGRARFGRSREAGPWQEYHRRWQEYDRPFRGALRRERFGYAASYDAPFRTGSRSRYEARSHGPVRDQAFEPEPGRMEWYGGGGWRRKLEEPVRGETADTVRAAEIMTRNPEAVTADTPVQEVAQRMRDLDVGVMPVIESEESQRLEGIVTDRDIAIRAAAEGKDLKKTAVREIMSKDPHTVFENDHVRDVFALMKRERVRRVPVTGRDGSLVGIISQADLAVNYAGLDLQRETEVEEVIERISEPARPRWGREGAPDDRRVGRRLRHTIDVDLPGRVRSGWQALRREARGLMRRGYDAGWR